MAKGLPDGVPAGGAPAGALPHAVQALSSETDRRTAAEFYGLYSRTRLMLVREFGDKGLARAEAVAAAQEFLDRLMFAFFAEAAGLARGGEFGDGIAGVLEGGVGAGTRRVWDYIAGDLFPALGIGQADARAAAPGVGLFGSPLHGSALFPDVRDAGFFGEPGRSP